MRIPQTTLDISVAGSIEIEQNGILAYSAKSIGKGIVLG